MHVIKFEVSNCNDCHLRKWNYQDCGRDYYECSWDNDRICYDDKRGEAILRWADGKPTFCPAERMED
jgi:hypothetical protein